MFVYVYIYIYIYKIIYHHTVQVARVQVQYLRQWVDEIAPPVQVARVQVQYLRQWVDEIAPPVQVAEGEPPCVQVDYLH